MENNVQLDNDEDIMLLGSFLLAAPLGLALWGVVVWLIIR